MANAALDLSISEYMQYSEILADIIAGFPGMDREMMWDEYVDAVRDAKLPMPEGTEMPEDFLTEIHQGREGIFAHIDYISVDVAEWMWRVRIYDGDAELYYDVVRLFASRGDAYACAMGVL